MKLSFLAMLCGWIACNIALWVAYGVAMLFQNVSLLEAYRLDVTLIFLAITGTSIAAAWLVIFLPADLLVGDNSKLRRPRTAALAGLVSAALFACCYSYLAISSIPSDNADARLSVWMVFGTFGYGAMITGTVAAYVRAWMDMPRTRTST